MLDDATLELAAALAEASTRSEAATALAARVGASALLVFVEDADVDALLLAPATPQTLPGGPAWRTFLRECREAGTVRGTVAFPGLGTAAQAVACAGCGVALVFVGEGCETSLVEALRPVLPFLGSALRAESAVAAARGELVVAREDARHAAALTRALDAARADLERQAKILTEARGRAEDATRAKDEFLAMLGHELRNPLAPIVTALRIMRLNGSKTREQDVLERQVASLTRLVDDLLDVARITSGKVELRKERLELSTVTTRAAEMASPLLEQKHQVLTMNVPTSGMALNADPDRMAQVFSNLLTNAAKYSDARSHIVVSADHVSGKAVVRVTDEGLGIEPHMLDAVFELFIQQGQPMDRSRGGLGLGLAIVKNLVALHGGTVRARSDGRGKGSEFVVELPLALLDGSEIQESSRMAIRAAGSVAATADLQRVLVVDDNEDATEMMCAALSSLRYVVRAACDGPSGLRIAQEFRPQVALLDIGLPVMDGYELARKLRELAPADELRLVAVTGYGQASDKARAREAGFDAHLVKPVELDEIQRLLERFSAAGLDS